MDNIEKYTTISDFIEMVEFYAEKINTLSYKEYADIVNTIN